VSRRQLVAMLTLDIVACRAYSHAMDSGSTDPDATEFPFPADDTAYPTSPYTFGQTAGHLTVGSSRTAYDSLKLSAQNDLDGRWFEAAHLLNLVYTGRKTQLDAAIMLKASPDDLAAMEALTAQTTSVGFVQGGNSVTISLQGQNFVSAAPYDLPLNQVYMRNLTVKNYWSGSAGKDLDITVV
jgi:hypothetical protein